MERIGLRIKQLRTSKKLSQVEFSRRLSVTQSSISRYESCTGDPDAAFLTSLSREFPDLNTNWLLTGSGPMFQELPSLPVSSEDFLRLPVVARIAAGPPLEAIEQEPEEWIEVSRQVLSLPPPYYVFRVDGDSMEPVIQEGDYVVLSRDWRGLKLHGRICAFRTWEGITIKKFLYQAKLKAAWLMPINHSKYDPVVYTRDTEELQMIGVLCVLIRKY